jgi:hypothetical protein
VEAIQRRRRRRRSSAVVAVVERERTAVVVVLRTVERDDDLRQRREIRESDMTDRRRAITNLQKAINHQNKILLLLFQKKTMTATHKPTFAMLLCCLYRDLLLLCRGKSWGVVI